MFMERLYGRTAGVVVTVLICWTAFASVFALLLGYSRIPYAAARDGYFFSAFARLHPRGDFPHVSLLVLGAVTVVASFFPLDAVISALFTTRILVQFIAQIGAVAMLRRRSAAGGGDISPAPSVGDLRPPPGGMQAAPDPASRPSTFRMALYPLPARGGPGRLGLRLRLRRRPVHSRRPGDAGGRRHRLCPMAADPAP